MFDPFPCVACGACCMDVRHVPELLERGWVGPDGICTQLDLETNKCRSYAERPTICRVDDIRPPLMNPETWRRLNLLACDALHRKVYAGPLCKESCTHRKESSGGKE